MANEREGIVFPIVLVVLGLLFLAHNLEFIQWTQLREILRTWWPLILIALGIAQLARRRK